MATLAALATALLLWVGTRDVLVAWGISIGTLTAFLLLFQQFFTPITSLGDEWQTVQGALSGAERIFQFLGLPIDEHTAGADRSQRSASHRNGTAASGTPLVRLRSSASSLDTYPADRSCTAFR